MHYYSISESDQLNSTINTGNTFTSQDQARTLMVKQAPGAVPQQVLATSKSEALKLNIPETLFTSRLVVLD